MMIHEITEKEGRHPAHKRRGRGEGSGIGKTSGRGHKGAGSRAGWSLPQHYQGGQINFIQRMPKRGFNNAQFRTDYAIVNVGTLDRIANDGDEITSASLAASGIIRNSKLPLKILGEGELKKKLTVKAERFSASAKSKIEAAGGSVEPLGPQPAPVKAKPAPEKTAKEKPKSSKKPKAKAEESQDS